MFYFYNFINFEGVRPFLLCSHSLSYLIPWISLHWNTHDYNDVQLNESKV